MGNFRGGGRDRFNNRGGGFRGHGGNRGGRSDRGKDRGPVNMYKAVCGECGESCEVPFKPTNDKPVYCNACFAGRKGRNADSGSFERKSSNAPKVQVRTDRDFDNRKANSEIKSELRFMSEKIDGLTKLLEKVIANQEIANAKAKVIVKELPTAKKTKKSKTVKTKKPIKKTAVKRTKKAKKK